MDLVQLAYGDHAVWSDEVFDDDDDVREALSREDITDHPRPPISRVAEHFCTVPSCSDEPGDVAEDTLEFCGVLGAVGVLVLLAGRHGSIISMGAAGASGGVFLSANPHTIARRRTPALDAIRTGQPVWITSAVEMHKRYPEFVQGVRRRSKSGGMCALPLWQSGGVIGAVSIMFDRDMDFDAVTQNLITLLAALVARRVEHPWGIPEVFHHPDAALLGRMYDPVLIYRRSDDRFIFANPAALELLEHGREQVLFAPPDRVLRRVLNDSGESVRLCDLPIGVNHDVTILREDGERRIGEVHLGDADSEGRQMLVIIDRTEVLNGHDEVVEAEAEFRVVEERERLARELHDGVIQTLFATALTLAAAPSRHDGGPVVDTVRWAVSELDAAIRELRATVFDLHSPDCEAGGARSAIQRVVFTAERAAGIRIALDIDDGVEERIDGDSLHHVLRVLRESLSNVARHAEASEAWVRLTTADDLLELLVEDNGVGLPESKVLGDGLQNMVTRAEAIGGQCEIGRRAGGGTAVRWAAPLGDRSSEAPLATQKERCS